MDETRTRGSLRVALVAVFFAVAALVSAGVLAPAAPARADTYPAAGTPATVSADALPTWQINGVVWSQATFGNRVWATGSFSAARPPGVPAGGAGEVPAGNLFVFDITTGSRIASLGHNLNAQGLVAAVSPDGKRVYVGGDFTTVDGVAHSRLVAFDTGTGAVVPGFAPTFSGPVRALAVSATSVYVGGTFSTVNGAGRSRLAALSPANGALQPWAPVANDTVTAMTLTPDGSRVVVGGRFTTLNGTGAFGMGALNSSTGATLPWAANATIRDAGTDGAITSLRAAGGSIYGAGYSYGNGSNFEGTFAADPATGRIQWLNDCHGDSYDVYPLGWVLYSVSHAHDCSPIGSFPDTKPRQYHRAMASTIYATGMNRGPDSYGWNYSRFQASSVLHWWPTLTDGTYTGQNQGPWSITGNADYLVLGGEFPTVNGVAQQGLVRFAVSSKAPNKMAPKWSSALTPTAFGAGTGKVRLSWGTTWDQDNQLINYTVYRDGAAVYSQNANSTFWSLPTMSWTDSGLASNSSHRYYIQATDAFGNRVVGGTVTGTAGWWG